MASFTQSIREILQYNKTASQSLDNVSDVYDIATACLFDKMPANVINNDYKERFITGFTLHFMNEEIGYETLPLWKIALNEKIYNRGSYINLIFENLDKEIFADYSVKNSNKSGEHSIERRGTGTVENVRDDDTTTTTEDTLTRNELVENTKDGTVEGTGTVTNAKTGTDTTLKTGTDVNEKSGMDTHKKTGTDTLTQTGTDERAHTGTMDVATTGDTETVNTGTTGTDHNLIQVQSDTPMGSLSNLRTPGGDARGTGVTYANGQTYNYMSAAQEVDESNVQTDNTTQNVDSSENATTTYDDTITDTKNRTDATQHNTTDTDLFGSKNTETLNLSDATTYGATDTETRATLDTTSISDNTETTGTDQKTGTVTVEGTVQDTQTRNTTDTDEGTHSETEAVTDYSLNWEMLYRSMPLLNKVWEQFDDLFMQIF